MNSKLQKSIYMGIATLTFVSVANFTVPSVNAKSHKRVKHSKITYKTTNKRLNQNIVFKSTGKHAIYTKPTGVKGYKMLASKKQMKAKAKSNKVQDQFMAYQKAVTNKGYHYYKVVSFDKKIRGYVFNKGIVKTNLNKSIAIPIKNMGHLNINSLYDGAYGSRFNINSIHFNNNDKHKFIIKKAKNVNGIVFYNVVDSSDNSVNGWVKKKDFNVIKENHNIKKVLKSKPTSYVPVTNNDSENNVIKVTPTNNKETQFNEVSNKVNQSQSKEPKKDENLEKLTKILTDAKNNGFLPNNDHPNIDSLRNTIKKNTNLNGDLSQKIKAINNLFDSQKSINGELSILKNIINSENFVNKTTNNTDKMNDNAIKTKVDLGDYTVDDVRKVNALREYNDAMSNSSDNSAKLEESKRNLYNITGINMDSLKSEYLATDSKHIFTNDEDYNSKANNYNNMANKYNNIVNTYNSMINNDKFYKLTNMSSKDIDNLFMHK